MPQSESLEILIASADPEAEVFDFSSPEDVLIEVAVDLDTAGEPIWDHHSIECSTVLNGAPGITGAASYEENYGGGLSYTIESMIDCPGAGFFVVEGITGTYHKGDWGFTDDDMDFEFKSVRRATPEEVARI